MRVPVSYAGDTWGQAPESGGFLSGAREDGTDEPTGDGIGTVIVAGVQLVVPSAAVLDADVVRLTGSGVTGAVIAP